jgi:hypothetical protein
VENIIEGQIDLLIIDPMDIIAAGIILDSDPEMLTLVITICDEVDPSHTLKGIIMGSIDGKCNSSNTILLGSHYDGKSF